MACDAFIDALEDASLEQRVRDKLPETLDEAFRLAEVMENRRGAELRAFDRLKGENKYDARAAYSPQYNTSTGKAIPRWLPSIRVPLSKEQVLDAAPNEFKAVGVLDRELVRLLTATIIDSAWCLSGEYAGRALLRMGGDTELVTRFTGFDL